MAITVMTETGVVHRWAGSNCGWGSSPKNTCSGNNAWITGAHGWH